LYPSSFDTRSPLQWIQRFPLDIFHESLLEEAVIRHVAHDGGYFEQPRPLGRGQPALAGNELVPALKGRTNTGCKMPFSRMDGRQPFQARLVHAKPGLAWIGGNPVDVEFRSPEAPPFWLPESAPRVLYPEPFFS